MREEIILESVGNQEEYQREISINPKDQEIAEIVGNKGTTRKISRLERTVKEKNKMETRRKMW